MRKPDAIVLAAADYKRLIPVADEIWAAGIPLITIDSFIESTKPLIRIGTDNYTAGVQAGDTLIEIIGKGKNLAIITRENMYTSEHQKLLSPVNRD